jgi:transcriptional regulator with AAA-type ATPase domain
MARARSPLKSLAAALEGSRAIVALFDAERRLLYANGPCAALLQADMESLVGREALYTSEPLADPLDAAVAKLAPPPQVFAGEALETTWSDGNALGDSPRHWRVRFLPLPTTAADFAVLVVAEPHDSADDMVEPSASRDDWHAALLKVRSLLPSSLRSEFLLGDSPAMQRVRAQVEMAASAKANTVVVGPRGTGVEAIARTILGRSGNGQHGVVSLQCSIQDAESLEAALRSLLRRKDSQSERLPAILLRDVGRLSAEAQQELLGFVQLPGFAVRIVATSRVSLTRLIKKGGFSAPLAALLGTLEIPVPPLQERPNDVPLLVQWFVERFNAQGKHQISGLVPEAMEQMVAYTWPGNVQEVEEVVTTACERSPGPWLLPGDFSERVRSAWLDLAHLPRMVESIQLDQYLADIEKELLSRALQQTKGNKSEASRLLGISRPRLLRRLVQLGLATREETAEAIDFQPIDDGELLGDAS